MALPPITPEVIAPFATLLRAKDGSATEVSEVLETGDVPGRHAFTILCPQPVAGGTINIAALERHPHSSQTFVPLKVGRWVVVVAPTLSDGSPDVAKARASIAGPEDAVCIARNVWHAGLTVLDRPGEIGMIMWRADAGDDGVLYQLDQPLVLTV